MSAASIATRRRSKCRPPGYQRNSAKPYLKANGQCWSCHSAGLRPWSLPRRAAGTDWMNRYLAPASSARFGSARPPLRNVDLAANGGRGWRGCCSLCFDQRKQCDRQHGDEDIPAKLVERMASDQLPSDGILHAVPLVPVLAVALEEVHLRHL